MPILVFLGFSVLDLGPMYATDTETKRRRQTKASPPIRGGGITNYWDGMLFLTVCFPRQRLQIKFATKYIFLTYIVKTDGMAVLCTFFHPTSFTHAQLYTNTA